AVDQSAACSRYSRGSAKQPGRARNRTWSRPFLAVGFELRFQRSELGERGIRIGRSLAPLLGFASWLERRAARSLPLGSALSRSPLFPVIPSGRSGRRLRRLRLRARVRTFAGSGRSGRITALLRALASLATGPRSLAAAVLGTARAPDLDHFLCRLP